MAVTVAALDASAHDVLLDDPDNRYVMIDSTIVRVHQQAACGKGGAKVKLWAAPAAD